MSNILGQYLVKTLNMTDEQVAALKDGEEFKSDALEKLLELDKKRIDSVVSTYTGQLADAETKRKEDSENQYKRGIKEGAAKYEKILKAAKLDWKDESELLEKLTSGKKADLDVTATEEYRNLEAALNDKTKEWEDKFSQSEAEFKRKEGMWKHVQSSYSYINDKAVGQPKAAVDGWNDFIMSHTVVEEGDRTIVKDSKGEIVRNAQKHPVTFNEFIEQNVSNYFVIKAQSDKSGTDSKAGEYSAPRVSDMTDSDRIVALKKAKEKIANAKNDKDKEAAIKEAQSLVSSQ